MIAKKNIAGFPQKISDRNKTPFLFHQSPHIFVSYLLSLYEGGSGGAKGKKKCSGNCPCYIFSFFLCSGKWNHGKLRSHSPPAKRLSSSLPPSSLFLSFPRGGKAPRKFSGQSPPPLLFFFIIILREIALGALPLTLLRGWREGERTFYFRKKEGDKECQMER